MELTKENRINSELERLSELASGVDKNQLAALTPLLQNAAFMKVTLEDLQEIINREGVTERYQNGANQHGIKQSATLQSYNALIKNYAAVVKAIARELPPEKRVHFQSPFMVQQSETPEEREERERKAKEEFKANAEYWSQKAKELIEKYEGNRQQTNEDHNEQEGASDA